MSESSPGLVLTPLQAACIALGYPSRYTCNLTALPEPNVKIFTHLDQLRRFRAQNSNLPFWYWDFELKCWKVRTDYTAYGTANWIYCRRLYWWELPPLTAALAGYNSIGLARQTLNRLLTLTEGYRWVLPGERKLATDECFAVEEEEKRAGVLVDAHWRLTQTAHELCLVDNFPHRRKVC